MKNWILAARLRTLPLSLSGIILAGFIAKFEGFFRLDIFILSLLTTLLFQILSNFANDYGDGIRGTDQNRKGEKRTVEAGLITAQQMKTAIILLIVLSILSVLILLKVAFLPEHLDYFLIFIGLGFASILAAIFYTIGKKPYGYIGLGDVFVFIFFGLISVLGGEFLYSKTFNWLNVLPAASIGLWSMAVLNLNNMRDMDNDVKNNKITLASKLGLKRAKVYQIALMNLPFILSLIYVLKIKPGKISAIAFMLLFFVTTSIRRQILKTTKNEEFDAFLKPTSILALIFAVFLGYSLLGFEFLNSLFGSLLDF